MAHHVHHAGIFLFSILPKEQKNHFKGALNFETFWITFHASILGTTLVASGVLSVRIRKSSAKRLFTAVAGLNALNAVSLFMAGWCATTLPDARLYSFAAEDYFFLFGLAAIAFAGDVRLIFGTRVTNRHRIAQHLVRMCIGFFIVAGSAFTEPGAYAFPEVVQNSSILLLPELAIVLFVLFWLWKTLRQPQRLITSK